MSRCFSYGNVHSSVSYPSTPRRCVHYSELSVQDHSATGYFLLLFIVSTVSSPLDVCVVCHPRPSTPPPSASTLHVVCCDEFISVSTICDISLFVSFTPFDHLIIVMCLFHFVHLFSCTYPPVTCVYPIVSNPYPLSSSNIKREVTIPTAYPLNCGTRIRKTCAVPVQRVDHLVRPINLLLIRLIIQNGCLVVPGKLYHVFPHQSPPPFSNQSPFLLLSYLLKFTSRII